MPKTKRRIQNKLRGFQKRPTIQFGLLGNYEHVVEVPDRPNYVYIRFAGQVLSEVYNDRVNPLEDLQVIVGYDPEEPNLFQVLGTRPIRRYGEDDSTTIHLPTHHRTHEWMAQPDGGNDVVFSQLRQFMPLRVTPTEDTMDVFLHRGMIYGGRDYGWIYVSGGYVDLTSYVPTTGSLYALLSVAQDGTPDITIGETKDTLFLTLADIPDPNIGCIPVTALRLYGDQTNVVEAYSSTDLVDLRFPGTRSFLSLQDAPSSYTGTAGMAVFVRGDELGLEFAEVLADGLGGGGTGTFVNPMIYRGDMIYSDAGSIILENVADYNVYGTRATGSSVQDPTFTPAIYVLRYGSGYNNEVDIWRNLVWTSHNGFGYSFDTAYVTIQLTGTYTLKGWSLRHSSTSNPISKAGQYEVATWHTGTWVVQATHSPTQLEEYVDFPSPVTTQFVRFRGIVNELGNSVGEAWTIQNIGLYKYGVGQIPTRLPYGTVGQVLTAQSITGSVPRWNWLGGDVSGTYNALQVKGILGKAVHAEPGHPDGGDIIRFSSANNRWELVSGSGGGVSTFTDLTDTPASYAGQSGKGVFVNAGEDGLEFLDVESPSTIISSQHPIPEFIKLGNNETLNPVISVGNTGSSDRHIREIGNVLYENTSTGTFYHLFYTGYNLGPDTDIKIHYAKSTDGFIWTKYAGNPVIAAVAEDPYLIKVSGTYYLYAEDRTVSGSIARWSSSNLISWSKDGNLTGLGDNQSPTVWIEENTWYLLYEQYPSLPKDIRLATSSNGLAFTPDVSNPVISPTGISWIDDTVVPDDIVKIGSVYHLTYHGKGYDGVHREGIARSNNLIDWEDSIHSPFYSSDTEDSIVTASMFFDTRWTFLYYTIDTDGIFRGYPIIKANEEQIFVKDLGSWYEPAVIGGTGTISPELLFTSTGDIFMLEVYQ